MKLFDEDAYPLLCLINVAMCRQAINMPVDRPTEMVAEWLGCYHRGLFLSLWGIRAWIIYFIHIFQWVGYNYSSLVESILALGLGLLCFRAEQLLIHILNLMLIYMTYVSVSGPTGIDLDFAGFVHVGPGSTAFLVTTHNILVWLHFHWLLICTDLKIFIMIAWWYISYLDITPVSCCCRWNRNRHIVIR